MAADTNIALRGQIIYSIYVRNHTEEGTFKALIPDLDRIKALGTDIIWLMPIHPIGLEGKKGRLGCPYANRDYRDVNPEYGNMMDFMALVDAIHQKGMKCIIDVVYNHTSPDAVLTKEHPEFYYYNENGSRGNRFGDWADVVDLDYGCKGLWDYQIASLVMWARIVDGFRCDVASFVPVEFWQQARAEVEKLRPGCIWLGETVHGSFGQLARKNGIISGYDHDMFKAFDMEYDYDIREVFDRYLEGKASLSHYLDMLNFQEWVYPENHIKMRCLENHDQKRICHYIKDDAALENFTAFLYFLKGTTLIYAGQEYKNEHSPSLFDKDVFERDSSKDISGLLKKLAEMKKNVLSAEDYFKGRADDEKHIAVLKRDDNKKLKTGVFSLRGLSGEVAVELPDGEYENIYDGKKVAVKDGRLRCEGRPIIIVSPSTEQF